MKDYEFDTLLGNAQDLASALERFRYLLNTFQVRDGMFSEEEYKRISDKVDIIFNVLDNYVYRLDNQN